MARSKKTAAAVATAPVSHEVVISRVVSAKGNHYVSLKKGRYDTWLSVEHCQIILANLDMIRDLAGETSVITPSAIPPVFPEPAPVLPMPAPVAPAPPAAKVPVPAKPPVPAPVPNVGTRDDDLALVKAARIKGHGMAHTWKSSTLAAKAAEIRASHKVPTPTPKAAPPSPKAVATPLPKVSTASPATPRVESHPLPTPIALTLDVNSDDTYQIYRHADGSLTAVLVATGRKAG